MTDYLSESYLNKGRQLQKPMGILLLEEDPEKMILHFKHVEKSKYIYMYVYICLFVIDGPRWHPRDLAYHMTISQREVISRWHEFTYLMWHSGDHPLHNCQVLWAKMTKNCLKLWPEMIRYGRLEHYYITVFEMYSDKRFPITSTYLRDKSHSPFMHQRICVI